LICSFSCFIPHIFYCFDFANASLKLLQSSLELNLVNNFVSSIFSPCEPSCNLLLSFICLSDLSILANFFSFYFFIWSSVYLLLISCSLMIWIEFPLKLAVLFCSFFSFFLILSLDSWLETFRISLMSLNFNNFCKLCLSISMISLQWFCFLKLFLFCFLDFSNFLQILFCNLILLLSSFVLFFYLPSFIRNIFFFLAI